ncbi:MAG: hypothetical protein ACI36V_02400 [Coriobacteriales bacterium]
MNASELKQSIQGASPRKRAELEKLFLFVTAGGEFRPGYEVYGQGASTYNQYFDALFADDSKKDSDVWAAWAQLAHRKWVDRFEPKIAIPNIRLKTQGIPVEFGSGIFIAPLGSKDTVADFYLFPSNGFNTRAADFVTSIGGTFKCVGYEFVGIYGVYKFHNTVIFEEWEAEKDPVPFEDGGCC